MSEAYLNILEHKELKENLPVIVDLFSGCGGLSIGFRTEGFKVVGGIEMSEHAVNNASYNLHWRYGEENEHICGDITKLEADIFQDSIKGRDVITIGGPPCQAYSRIGIAKLRSLGNDRINIRDSRGYLYQDFLRYVFDLESEVVVMENVPASTSYGKMNIPQHVCDILEKENYDAIWTILNAADYGVPQTRERIFVIATKGGSAYRPMLPTPTHCSPEFDYERIRNKYKKYMSSKNFRLPNLPKGLEPNWITVEEALSDLPSVFPTADSKYRLYNGNIQLDYKTGPKNDYQKLMRTWFGCSTLKITGHGFRRNERDFPIFERMKPGDNYIDASFIADTLLEEACSVLNINKYKDIQEYEELKKKIVPPYNREKFISKWLKLSPEKPSHTLVAHLSTDTYSHIHPWEPRGITVREAARLQSFPDGFIFQGPMGESFKQIGNAVPPLLSRAIAKALKKSIAK